MPMIAVYAASGHDSRSNLRLHVHLPLQGTTTTGNRSECTRLTPTDPTRWW